MPAVVAAGAPVSHPVPQRCFAQSDIAAVKLRQFAHNRQSEAESGCSLIQRFARRQDLLSCSCETGNVSEGVSVRFSEYTTHEFPLFGVRVGETVARLLIFSCTIELHRIAECARHVQHLVLKCLVLIQRLARRGVGFHVPSVAVGLRMRPAEINNMSVSQSTSERRIVSAPMESPWVTMPKCRPARCRG